MQQPKLTISSPEFIEGGLIPIKFTCKGEGFNPALVIDGVPEGTQSMVLIMEDPDTAQGTFTHWVVFDIQPAGSISENSGQGVSGINGRGEMGYTPPCPPSGIHRYYFHVFALDRGLDLRPGSDRAAVEEAMEPHILASGTLMGRFGVAVDSPGARTGDAATGETAIAAAATAESAAGGAATGKTAAGGAATEGYHEARTTVDESGAGAWTTDKKVQH
ncbi:MAG TPA: YbhB/YbcL family Raf kinase inhibitor-like protein [Puia sp.]|nr:YbhB/YbcL family Raf kinase inhibitor-like protein [Puia sp.]